LANPIRIGKCAGQLNSSGVDAESRQRRETQQSVRRISVELKLGSLGRGKTPYLA